MKNLIVVVCCLLIAGAAYAETPKDVVVVNTPDVFVANTPDVNVANVPEVLVANDQSSPIPVTIPSAAQSIVEWRYIGHTVYADQGIFEYDGLLGIAAMNKACATEFGASARAATISEALFVDSIADVEHQWLVPGASSMTLTYSAAYYTPFDTATGTQVGKPDQLQGPALVNAYCLRYTDDYGWGPTLTKNGAIGIEPCNSLSLPVACSAPVAIASGP